MARIWVPRPPGAGHTVARLAGGSIGKRGGGPSRAGRGEPSGPRQPGDRSAHRPCGQRKPDLGQLARGLHGGVHQFEALERAGLQRPRLLGRGRWDRAPRFTRPTGGRRGPHCGRGAGRIEGPGGGPGPRRAWLWRLCGCALAGTRLGRRSLPRRRRGGLGGRPRGRALGLRTGLGTGRPRPGRGLALLPSRAARRLGPGAGSPPRAAPMGAGGREAGQDVSALAGLAIGHPHMMAQAGWQRRRRPQLKRRTRFHVLGAGAATRGAVAKNRVMQERRVAFRK